MSGVSPGRERERALVVAAVAGALDRCWVGPADLPRLDWGWLRARLDELGLAAQLWAELAAAGREGAVPPAEAAWLRLRAEQNAAQNAQLLAAALRAGAALDGAGVAWMPVKGVALALLAPGYGAARHVADVDLVVHPADLARAARALGEVVPLLAEARETDGREKSRDPAARPGAQHVHCFSGGDGVLVELHHAFADLPPVAVTEGIFARAVRTRAGGRTVTVPALDDLLGTACVHALVHHRGDRHVLLRHLRDVVALVALGASGEAARERYDAGGLRTVARSFLALEDARRDALERGGPPSAASLAVWPARGGRAALWLREVGTRVRWVGARLAAERWRAVVPSRRFMAARYGRAADGPWLPWLHVRRWVAGALRAIRSR